MMRYYVAQQDWPQKFASILEGRKEKGAWHSYPKVQVGRIGDVTLRYFLLMIEIMDLESVPSVGQ